MSGLGRVVRAGAARRRVQTVIIGLATFMAVTSAVLGGSLLVASTGPFDDSFTSQHGAHLSVLLDGTKTAGTPNLAGVTETSGPFPVVVQAPHIDPGGSLPPLTIVGRPQPGTGIDRVSVVEGRWPSGPGEIALAEGAPLGAVMTFPALPGKPSLTVVGRARSTSQTAAAWVLPAAIPALTTPGTTPNTQILYRFGAPTSSTLDEAAAAITATTPPGTLLGSQSWLVLKAAADRNTALFVPFLVAFGLLGLVMAVLSIGGVVAGAAGAATGRIGVLKAIGYTPAQVVRGFLGQALIPAAIGTALGTAAGHAIAIPLLQSTSEVYETAPVAITSWVDVIVAAGALVLVTLTATVAALRAGRLRTVDALSAGRTTSRDRGRTAAVLAARVPLPRPVTLGLGQPFARPGRMAAMLATVVFGTAAVALAVGLGASISVIEKARLHDSAAIAVGPSGPRRQGPSPADGPPLDQVTQAVTAQAGTGAWYGIAEVPSTVAGVPGVVEALGFTADASWAGYEMTAGRWFREPGEGIVPTPLLTASGTKVGGTMTLTINGRSVPIRVVGEVFSTRHDGMQVFTSLGTLLPAQPDLRPSEYRIDLAAGADREAYSAALTTALKPLGLEARPNQAGSSEVLLALNALTGLLTAMLVAIAALGVLNMAVLQTHERVRDLGIHKALGMTPRQAVTVVLSSVLLIGLAGGALGTPAGVALHGVMMPAMGDQAGITLPVAVLDVYEPWLLALLIPGGLAIAILGALLPAGWAARLRTATALRTE
ncbi:ABC transporter permease [Longispora albida]|uniref:ABC transporter permease n=1 Tax=Longispora albida TaxID=203523 RepID=UPI00036AFAA1|nr:ABC transporter permease [Longispora albida]